MARRTLETHKTYIYIKSIPSSQAIQLFTHWCWIYFSVPSIFCFSHSYTHNGRDYTGAKFARYTTTSIKTPHVTLNDRRKQHLKWTKNVLPTDASMVCYMAKKFKFSLSLCNQNFTQMHAHTVNIHISWMIKHFLLFVFECNFMWL